MVNPYAPPAAALDDGEDERAYRVDGRRLVIPRHAEISRLCAYCGSRAALRRRTALLTWRNPRGLLATALVIAATILAGVVVPPGGGVYLLGSGLVGLVAVNVKWRSVRLRLAYTLCSSCRTRRGRWWLAWLVVGGLLVGLTAATEGFALLLFPAWLIWPSFIPATPQLARVTSEQIWLRKVSPSLLAQFPPLDGDTVVKKYAS